MADHAKIIQNMLLRISEFFRFMSDNKESRLYYVLPVQKEMPYAYQNSSIRDVATISDILDLCSFFKEKEMNLDHAAILLFEKVTQNTLNDYFSQYQKEDFYKLPADERNIGDIGFFLLALQKCRQVFVHLFQQDLTATEIQLIGYLLKRQNSDGSLKIFFNDSLNSYQKSVEAFYLPEALIGLISLIGSCPTNLDKEVTQLIKKALSYCCQEKIRKVNLSSENVIFYANWQLQLLYYWLEKQPKELHHMEHLEKIIVALQKSPIANDVFAGQVATVEVACYMEGLVHALQIEAGSKHNEWLRKEIIRSLQFLHTVQDAHYAFHHGGFTHSLYSHEARIDVAGHVFNALRLIKQPL